MEDWLLMLDSAGRVIATGGGAPRELMDAALLEDQAVGREIREAAARLLARLRNPLRTATLEREVLASTDRARPTVELLAAAAVPIRNQAVDLSAIVNRALDSLARQARERGVALSIESASSLPSRILLDPEKLAWATATLVGTALRYVRTGTTRGPGGNIRVTLSYDRLEAAAIIGVADDGPGMPAATVEEARSRCAAAWTSHRTGRWSRSAFPPPR